MRISDWSSDVCSSDLRHRGGRLGTDEVAHQFNCLRPLREVLGVVWPDMYHFFPDLEIHVDSGPACTLCHAGRVIVQDLPGANKDKERWKSMAIGIERRGQRVSGIAIWAEVRSDESRVGKECVSKCRSRLLPYP